MKCLVPTCNKQLPPWREKSKRITCSKKCGGAWHHLPSKLREEIRGKKYNRRLILSYNENRIIDYLKKPTKRINNNKRISYELNLSLRCVMENIKRLEEKKYIFRKRLNGRSFEILLK